MKRIFSAVTFFTILGALPGCEKVQDANELRQQVEVLQEANRKLEQEVAELNERLEENSRNLDELFR